MMRLSARSIHTLFLLPGLALVGVFYLLPLVRVLWLSVGDPEIGGQNYDWLANSTATRRILWATLRISAITATLSVVFGFLVAYVIWLSQGLRRDLLIGAVLVAFWLSVLVRCFALVMVLRPQGPFAPLLAWLGTDGQPLRLVRNEIGVIIGMVHYLMPFAILTILAVLEAFDRRLIDAARSMAAPRLLIFTRVVLPLSLGGVGAAWALTFVLALGFYITPAILGGGRVVMIAEFITYHVQDILAWGKAAALSVLLLAVLAVGWLALYLPRLGPRPTGAGGAGR